MGKVTSSNLTCNKTTNIDDVSLEEGIDGHYAHTHQAWYHQIRAQRPLPSQHPQDHKCHDVGGQLDATAEHDVEVLVAVQVGDEVGDAVVAEGHREPDKEEDETAKT